MISLFYFETIMIRTFGKQDNYKIVVRNNCFYTFRWGWEPMLDEEGKETGYGYYSEHTFPYKPSISDVKNFVVNAINEDTDYRILTEFSFSVPINGQDEPLIINCYLSQENQFNYKAAYDLAVQTQGASLPFRLKFGSNTEPQYYDFTTLEEFSQFYLAAINFINTALKEGWKKKDGINWDEYEEELKKI